MVMRSLCAGDALDPRYGLILVIKLSLSLSLSEAQALLLLIILKYLQVSFPRPGPLISLSEIVDY